jgi:hypothetical protein
MRYNQQQQQLFKRRIQESSGLMGVDPGSNTSKGDYKRERFKSFRNEKR